MSIYLRTEDGRVVDFFSKRRVTPEEEMLVDLARDLQEIKKAQTEEESDLEAN